VKIRIVGLAGSLVLAACQHQPDLSEVEAQREAPVQRYDAFLAAANNGRVLATAGQGGTVLVSADGGANWQRQQLEAPASIIDMASCPDQQLVALDFYGRVWLSDDAAAAKWSSHALPEDLQPMAVSCDPSGRLWVVGSFTTIASSTDGGQNWTTTDFGEDAFFNTVQFTDAMHGFITGEFGTVMATADAGETWEPLPPLDGEFYPYAALFTDPQTGYVAGIGGVMRVTHDGGQTWAEQVNETGAPMYDIVAVAGDVVGIGAGGRLMVHQGDRWMAPAGIPAVPVSLATGAPAGQDALLVAGSGGALQLVALVPGAQLGMAAVAQQGL